MSAKRKNPSTATKKGRGKAKKVEYDSEDISSEHDSEVEDADAGSNVDAEDAVEDADDLANVASMPELPPPEVRKSLHFKNKLKIQENSADPRFV